MYCIPEKLHKISGRKQKTQSTAIHIQIAQEGWSCADREAKCSPINETRLLCQEVAENPDGLEAHPREAEHREMLTMPGNTREAAGLCQGRKHNFRHRRIQIIPRRLANLKARSMQK